VLPCTSVSKRGLVPKLFVWNLVWFAWKWTCKRKHFYINSFAPRLVPTKRQKPTWEWPIKYSQTFVFIAPIYYTIYCSQPQLTTATRRYCSSAWFFKRDLIYPRVIFRANPDVYFFNRGFISPLVLNMTRLSFLCTAKARNACYSRFRHNRRLHRQEVHVRYRFWLLTIQLLRCHRCLHLKNKFCNWSSKNVLWSYRNMLRLTFLFLLLFFVTCSIAFVRWTDTPKVLPILVWIQPTLINKQIIKRDRGISFNTLR